MAIGAVVSMGYGVVFSLTDNYRDADGISPGAIGLVIGIGFLSGFFAQVLLAPLADRGHARAMVLGGLAMYVAGLVAMAFSHEVWNLLGSRFTMGIGAGMVGPASRRMVILSDRANLGRNLGRLLAADVTGFAAGPAVSSLLVGPLGIAGPYLVIAALAALLLAIAARIEGIAEERVARDAETPRFALDLLRHRAVAAAALLGAAVFLMIGAFDALWSLAMDDLHAADWLSSLGITMFALPLVILGPFGGRLAQRIGPYRWGAAGLLVAAACTALYGWMPTAISMFAVAMVHSVSDGLTVSSSSVAVGMAVDHDRQAAAQGLMGGLQTLIGGITAPVIGMLYERHGRDVAYTAAAIGMLTLTAAGAIIARPVWRHREPKPAGQAVPPPVAPSPAHPPA